jgi:hypothetical protein
MMKLVVKTSVGDGYTFSCEVVRPVLYESAEALLVHLEEAAKAAKEKGENKFSLAGHTDWTLDEFGCSAPVSETQHPRRRSRSVPVYGWVWNLGDVEIMTVDEWFNKEAGIPSEETTP